MKLRKCDAGRVFTAPSGRRVLFSMEVDGVYMFTYEDDPTDGLALSSDGLRILELAPRVPAAASVSIGPVGIV